MYKYFQCLKCRDVVEEGGIVEINRYLFTIESLDFKEDLSKMENIKIYMCKDCYGVV